MASERERIQLNLRLDGHRELLDAVKAEAEAAEISVNAFVIRALQAAIGQTPATPVTAISTDMEAAIAPVLDKLLADRLADIKASQASAIEQLRQELGEVAA